MTDNKANTVKIAKAKGRPMLQWVGKRLLDHVIAYPAQLVETFDANKASLPVAAIGWSDWPERFPKAGLLFHGDNKDCLAYLLANGFRGKIKLIYIDPPFGSGADYVRTIELRGVTQASKLEGEGQSLGEQVQYTDLWANDNYLQFMYERLLLLKELLAPNGTIVVHCDWNVSHRLRCILDEVFMADNFINEIVWQHAVIGAGRGIYRRLPKAHETLFVYVKNDEYVFNTDDKEVRVPYKDRITKNLRRDQNGSYYTRGRTGTDNPWSKDPRYLKTYVNIAKGKLIHDVWDDILTYRAQGDEYVGYPTQKPEQLVSRVVALLSEPGDIILDCFVGSGTTASVAQKVGRRWLACDINKGAIQTTAKRLQGIMSEQFAKLNSQKQHKLDTGEEEPEPVQLSYCLYRVNDYDLQIQHNEAVELACELIGITRTRYDAYFDGTFRNTLAKIIPFNHPLTPLDLEGVKSELTNRPEEERDITVVCLGMELAAKAWIEQHNRNRPINKIHVIELRTDKKYGGVIKHEPMSAEVDIRHEHAGDGTDRVVVEIRDVVSPTIVQRLNMDATLFRARITDWRAVVDTVLIDMQYDGQVFNVALSDVPPRKQDVVRGRYEFPAPPPGSTVAVKIIDMLGEELVCTATV